jgi:hypothetical protein
MVSTPTVFFCNLRCTSDRHCCRRRTTSFGELSRLPSNRSRMTVIEPSYSVRVTRRLSCSQVTSRSWRLEGLR